MKQTFPKSLDSLEDVSGFVDTFLESYHVDGEPALQVRLVVEEIFTNTVKHASTDAGSVAVTLGLRDGSVAVTVTDFGVPPFDIRQHQPEGLDRPLQERKSGGMGLHLVNTIASRINYQYKHGVSRITMMIDMEK